MPFDTQPILWQVKPKWLKQQKGTSCCCSSFCCFKLNGGVPTIGGFKMMCLFSRLGGKIKHRLDPGSLASPWGLTARAADMEENITRWGEIPPKISGFSTSKMGQDMGLYSWSLSFSPLNAMMIGKLPFSFLGMLQIQWEIITGNSSSEAADSSDSSLRGFRHQVSAEFLSLQIWMIYMILIRLRSEIGKYWRWNLQVSWRCFVLNHEKSILTPCFDSVWQQPHPASHLGDWLVLVDSPRLLVREGTLLKEIGALQLERAAGLECVFQFLWTWLKCWSTFSRCNMGNDGNDT